MTFKEALNADIKNVFINLDEFADIHTINGKKISAVLDDDLTTDRAVKGGTGTDEYGNIANIFFGTKTMFVSAEELGFKPVIGNNLRVDGTVYTVVNVAENIGVYEITIRANGGR